MKQGFSVYKKQKLFNEKEKWEYLLENLKGERTPDVSWAAHPKAFLGCSNSACPAIIVCSTSLKKKQKRMCCIFEVEGQANDAAQSQEGMLFIRIGVNYADVFVELMVLWKRIWISVQTTMGKADAFVELMVLALALKKRFLT